MLHCIHNKRFAHLHFFQEEIVCLPVQLLVNALCVAVPSAGPPGVFIVRDTASSSDLGLICHVSGQPFPTITWKVNGTKILNSTRYTITQSGDNSILSVRLPEWGSYSCEGTNANPYQNNTSQRMSSDSYVFGGTGECVTHTCSTPNLFSKSNKVTFSSLSMSLHSTIDN